jgi:hypothetical protein
MQQLRIWNLIREWDHLLCAEICTAAGRSIDPRLVPDEEWKKSLGVPVHCPWILTELLCRGQDCGVSGAEMADPEEVPHLTVGIKMLLSSPGPCRTQRVRKERGRREGGELLERILE